ncbi:class I SAM-dependent methyltransferase [Roseovarius sp. LXJ103]|uniref:class I SAM-dependent DNA methyltransferase n=1 Tax=Roseovarius carneus TaxID=2853164 RepID=UPI000D604CF5|nr:class I SAM-dependent methyltransferase [Roseovarius carneus]MBZ8117269.1 class I SAM-dependent methyltransferase [Roseovarius carneus]PWE36905.1 class I SAM-dependent methyltransferase [Pelagicola sp. LXJ1103]
MSGTEHLEDVYAAQSAEDTRRVYNKRSHSYNADNLSRGFRLPFLAAGLLAQHLKPDAGPVLDAGSGTGLVGETLRLMGFDHLIACDVSPEMLCVAAMTEAYESFHETDIGAHIPIDDNLCAGFVCVGAFGPGHAPPRSLIELARVTRPGGIGVFNLLEAHYVEQGFPDIMQALTETGRWEEVHVTPPFLPFLLAEPELWSRAYVMRML